MKICTQCKIGKPLSEYYAKGKKTESRLQAECKTCFNKRMARRWENYKIRFIEIKGEHCSCSICGYNKCLAALEFHHLDSEEKDFQISKGYSYSFERIKKELEKCILVCANCHREIHNPDQKAASSIG